jgi:hypothetical protein
LYNDGTTVSTNANLFLIMQAVYTDGTATLVSGAEFHTLIKVEFEDT